MLSYLKLVAALELEAHSYKIMTLPAVSFISEYMYYSSGHFYLQRWAED